MKTDWQNTLTGKNIKSCRLSIRTLICAILSAISLSAACQGYRYQEKALKFNMGIKCGALYSDMLYSALTTATSIGNIAPAAGATTELRIYDIVSIGIEAIYTQLGTNKHFYVDYLTSYSNIGTSHIEYHLKSNAINFRIPVSFYFTDLYSHSTWLRTYLTAAPDFFYILNGNMDWKWTHLDDNSVVDKKSLKLSSANMRPLNYGIMGGIGVWARYEIGTSNVISKLEAVYHYGLNNTFSDAEINNAVTTLGWGDLEHEELGSRTYRGIEVTLTLMFERRKQFRDPCNSW